MGLSELLCPLDLVNSCSSLSMQVFCAQRILSWASSVKTEPGSETEAIV